MDSSSFSEISSKTPTYYRCSYGQTKLLTESNYYEWSAVLTAFLKSDHTWDIVIGNEKEPIKPNFPKGKPKPNSRLGRPVNRPSTRRNIITDDNSPEMEDVDYEESDSQTIDETSFYPPNEKQLNKYKQDIKEFKKELKEYSGAVAQACSMILSSVSDNMKRSILTMTDPQLMWKTLQSHDELKDDSGIYTVRNQFIREKFTTGSIATFLANLKNYQLRLQGTKYELRDIDLIAHVLSPGVLPSNYATAIEYLEQYPNINWVHLETTLYRKERKVNIENPTTAMVVKSNGFRKTQKRKQNYKNDYKNDNHNSKRPAKELTCFYYSIKGYIETECWYKTRAEAYKKERFNKKGNSNEKSDNEAMANIATASLSSRILACTSLKPHDKSYRNSWFLDSCASDHIANDRNLFSNLRKLSTPISVSMGDDSTVYATEIGTITLRTVISDKITEITATDVLYVPELGTNLISVWHLNKNKFNVSFTNEMKATILDQNGQCIANAFANGRIYQLSCEAMKPQRKNIQRALIANSSKPETLHTWHQRLGHLNYPSIKAMSKTNDIKISDLEIMHDKSICVACLEGKFTRSYNKGPSSRATEKLELIHSDLCGPFTGQSITGSKYYIIYIDDKSRAVFVRFLKGHTSDKTLEEFKSFKVLVENQTGYKIKRFRCDNGLGEYNNHQFRGFLSINGISYEPSAPYTQNENGVAERMIRTINNIARSLLSDSGLTGGFWEEAVKTAVYLRNRHPTKALELYKTPYEIWYNKKPNLKHLRRFGCDAYIKIHPNLRTKWKPIVRHCIFIGYNDNTEKQYRVWDKSSKRIMIVAETNIIFNEHSTTGREIKLNDYESFDKFDNENHKLSMDSHGNAGEHITLQPPTTTDITIDKIEEPMTIGPVSQVQNPELESQLENSNLRVSNEVSDDRRYPKRERKPSFKLRSAAYSVRARNDIEPLNYKMALQNKHVHQWKNAMQEEKGSLDNNKTWDLVEESQVSGKRIIGCK